MNRVGQFFQLHGGFKQWILYDIVATCTMKMMQPSDFKGPVADFQTNPFCFLSTLQDGAPKI